MSRARLDEQKCPGGTGRDRKSPRGELGSQTFAKAPCEGAGGMGPQGMGHGEGHSLAACGSWSEDEGQEGKQEALTLQPKPPSLSCLTSLSAPWSPGPPHPGPGSPSRHAAL